MELPRAVHRLAVAAAVVTFLLLTVGGVVTSRDAGMVFADWPLSDGSINPDGWTQDPDKASEHGHRLLGALAGLLTIALAVALQRHDPRPWMRKLGWIALVAVCVQGLLGGLRVTEISGALALLHGCTGQAFLCLMVALAYLTSRDALRPARPGPDARRLALCGGAVVFVLYMQIVLGAQLRHNNGPVQAHLLGAVLASGTVFWLMALALLGPEERPALRRPALLLGALLLVQLGLGLATNDLLARTNPREAAGLAQTVLPTAHQTVGALMLATSVVFTLRAVRRCRAAPAGGEVYA